MRSFVPVVCAWFALSGCGGGCRADPDGDTDSPPGVDSGTTDTVPAATGDTADDPPDRFVVDVTTAATTAIFGVDPLVNAGGMAVDVGDTDGDGSPDLVIKSPLGGVVWRFAGPLPPGEISVADAAATVTVGARIGNIAATGDLGAMASPDYAVSAPDFGAGEPFGMVAVIDGTDRGPLDVDDSAAMLAGRSNSDAGYGGLAAGDLTGDGLPDLAITEGGHPTTAVWIAPGPLVGSLVLEDQLAVTRPSGAVGDKGLVVDDLDGDGVDDLVVALPSLGPAPDGSGATLLFGPIGADTNLDVPDARISGICNWAHQPAVLDADGDGVLDLALGSRYCRTTVEDAGRLFLFHGPFAPERDADTADAMIDGHTYGQHFASVVASAGDVDGDGADDLLAGAEGTGVYPWDGAAWLFVAVVGHVATSDATTKFPWAYSNHSVGSALLGASDLDGDGVRDLVIGAVGDHAGGTGAGASYVLSTSLW